MWAALAARATVVGRAPRPALVHRRVAAAVRVAWVLTRPGGCVPTTQRLFNCILQVFSLRNSRDIFGICME